MGWLAAPNLIAQTLSPLAGAETITLGEPGTMFGVLTGIAAVNFTLVGVPWLVGDGHPADGQPSPTSKRLLNSDAQTNGCGGACPFVNANLD